MKVSLFKNCKLTGLAPLQIGEHFKEFEGKITFISDIHELHNAGFDKNN